MVGSQLFRGKIVLVQFCEFQILKVLIMREPFEPQGGEGVDVLKFSVAKLMQRDFGPMGARV